MLRVGLTGGLASGKSFVGKTLEALGCHLLRADELGHLVLAPDGEAYAGVVKVFGREILNLDLSINRRALASIVFQQPERLASLNALVHPPVIERQLRWLAGIEAVDAHGIAVVEAAILIETGSYRRFNRLILAVCTEEQQIERAMKRDGLTREEVGQRLRRQMSLAEKRKFADYVIDTSGGKEDTARQVGVLYETLRSLKL